MQRSRVCRGSMDDIVTISTAPRSSAHTFLLRDMPLVKGVKPPSSLGNLLITLIIFLVLLVVFNVGYSIIGETGALRGSSGEISLNINIEHVSVQVEKYAGFLHDFSINPNVLLSITLVMVIISLINLIPSHVNLMLSRFTANLTTMYAMQLGRLFMILSMDLLVKVLVTLFISALGLSLLAVLIDDVSLLATFQSNFIQWWQAASFMREQTVIQAAFYSALYINAWFIIYYLSLLVTRFLYLTSVGRHSLRYFKVKERPFAVTASSPGTIPAA